MRYFDDARNMWKLGGSLKVCVYYAHQTCEQFANPDHPGNNAGWISAESLNPT